MALPEEALTPDPEFTLGDRLRKARERAGIKSAKVMADLLAERFGQPVSAGAVTAWERGTNQPTRIRLQEVVEAYADICHVRSEWLFTRSRCFGALGLASAPFGQMELAFGERPDLALV